MIVLGPDFMTITCKKGVQNFEHAFSKVLDRVKSVALWSTKKKKKRTIKGYGSAARTPDAKTVKYSAFWALPGAKITLLLVLFFTA